MLKSVRPGHPEALFGGTGADGKGSSRQTLMAGQRATITGGDPLNRMMGHYGKNAPALLPGDSSPDDRPPMHPAMNEVRGQSGGIKEHPKFGGIGPGTMGAVGPDTPSSKDPDQT
jgi:hypothetical protein